MDRVWKNPKHPAGYGGKRALHAAMRGRRSKAEVGDYLRRQRTYRKFKPPRRNFRRAPVLSGGVGHVLQADLFVLEPYARANKGARYLLVVVDVLTRRIAARAMRKKSASETAVAFEECLHELPLAPYALLGTDIGSEFHNATMQRVYKQYNIGHYALRAPLKAQKAELAGRHLKDRIYKHMEESGSRQWADKLQDFVHAANKRKKAALAGMAPIDITVDNQALVIEHNRRPSTRRRQKALPVGTIVNIAKDKMPFAKSFHGHFVTDREFRVIKQHDHADGIVRYTLEDCKDSQEISGTYYAEELQVVP